MSVGIRNIRLVNVLKGEKYVVCSQFDAFRSCEMAGIKKGLPI